MRPAGPWSAIPAPRRWPSGPSAGLLRRAGRRGELARPGGGRARPARAGCQPRDHPPGPVHGAAHRLRREPARPGLRGHPRPAAERRLRLAPDAVPSRSDPDTSPRGLGKLLVVAPDQAQARRYLDHLRARLRRRAACSTPAWPCRRSATPRRCWPPFACGRSRPSWSPWPWPMRGWTRPRSPWWPASPTSARAPGWSR
jgi:hypothetical protein